MSGPNETDLKRLVEEARRSRRRAYAPYSGYRVGAAVMTTDSEGGVGFGGGCNIENAMYGATVCAERVAIWGAIAGGAERIVALAVVTPNGATPCGACRQVLAEFAAPDTPVLLARPEGPAGDFEALTLGDLLPRAWGAKDLESAE